MSTLIWKEFREHVRWLPIGLIAVAVIAWMAAPGPYDQQTLIARDLVNLLSIVLPLLTFGLGVVQSYRDVQPSAADYLNHRSVTASDVFLAKVAAGFAIYASAVVLPLLMMAAWIALQGLTWYPMRPAQVIPPLVFALAAFLMHPAAMLTMVRAASWWGTRLFPLVPAGAALVPFAFFLRSGGFAGAAYGGLAALLALVWLLAIARQVWRDLGSDPPAGRINDPLRRRWLLPSYLTVSALLIVLALCSGVMVAYESLTRSNVYSYQSYNQLVVNTESGDPWLVTYKPVISDERGGSLHALAAGDAIEDGKTVNPLQPIDDINHLHPLVTLTPLTGSQYTDNDGFISLSGYRFAHRVFSFDHRGYLLGYGGNPLHWQRTVAADGVVPAGQFVGQRFTVDPTGYGWQVFRQLAQAGYLAPLIDARGIYLLEDEPLAIRKVLDRDIDSAALFQAGEDRTPRLIVRSGSELSEYRLLDASGSETWFEKPPPGYIAAGTSRSLSALGISAELVRTVNLPPPLAATTILSVAPTDDGFVLTNPSQFRLVYKLSADGGFQRIRYDVAPGTTSPPAEDRVQLTHLLAASFPGIVWVAVATTIARTSASRGMEPAFLETVSQHPVQATAVVIAFVVVLLVALVLIVCVARTRDLRRGQAMAWALSTPLLGLAAPLAMLAVYRAVHREPCPQCERPRRVDQLTCPHCASEWEPPPDQGIEISDRQQVTSRERLASLA